jgi:hypothetical protein
VLALTKVTAPAANGAGGGYEVPVFVILIQSVFAPTMEKAPLIEYPPQSPVAIIIMTSPFAVNCHWL